MQDKIEAIRNRTLSVRDQAAIIALAGKTNEAVEDQMPGPVAEPPMTNDTEFYCQRVMEFYEVFSGKNSQSNATALALAAATLKASVVLGGLIKDLTEVIKKAIPKTTTIPVKPAYTGKKRGRPPRVK